MRVQVTRLWKPLARLFTDLVTQLKLLTPSGQGGNPNYDGKVRNGWQTNSNSGHRWHANGHYHKKEEANIDHHHRSSIRHIGHQQGNKDGHKNNFSRRPHTRINEGAGRCITSYDCYNSLHPKYKTELFPSSVKIRAANDTFTSNRGECDVTFRINKERFTFPFLCSDQLSQQMILGHNFSEVHCIGTLWNVDDVMSLTRN